MPELAARLRRLRRLPRPQRVASLRSVLPWATGDELEAFAAEAIEHAGHHHHREALLCDVLRAWPRLSTEARAAAVVVANGDLADLVDALAGEGSRSDRRAAAEIAASCLVRETPSPEPLRARLVLVLHRLSDDEGAVAQAALNGLASTYLKRGEHDELDALLDAAMADAASRYHEHRHDGVLCAISDQAQRTGPRVAAWLNEGNDAGHMALRSLARRQDPKEALERAVVHLGVPSLAPSAVSVLERAQGAVRALPLAQAHLLKAHRRSASLGRVRSNASILGESWDETMPVEARAGAIGWIEHLPMKPTQRVERLHEVTRDPDPGVRLRACLVLRNVPAGPQADLALRDFARDPDERVAHAALSTLVTTSTRRRREAQAELFAELQDSVHASVRRLASGALEAVRHRVIDDEEVRAALGSHDRGETLEAIARVGRAGRAGVFADELLAIVEGGDPFCAARAVRALTNVEGEPVRLALLGALGHSDARVVADAVESLGTRDGGGISMKAFRTSSAARVRANAIMHALRTDDDPREARGALAEMLNDPRASHRLSALWVTQRTGQTALAERVSQLARDDEQREVRVRAEACADRLLARMRDGWAHAHEIGRAAAG